VGRGVAAVAHYGDFGEYVTVPVEIASPSCARVST
jgi:hypothetical protein